MSSISVSLLLIYLIFLSKSSSFHSFMSSTAHYIPSNFENSNFFRSKANLPSPRNSFSLGSISCHSCCLSS
uniref:Secreted protein n=1 Tax=Meloidogyne incognita TaxID=6306 RepID=A0A914M1L4_MELIC